MKRLICLLFTLIMLLGIVPAMAADPYINVYAHGDREQKRIAVTIDDWFNSEVLPDFLDVAKEYGCKLTLYPIGINLHEKEKDNWQRAVDEGHEIGNHTNTHANLDKLSRDRITRQLTNMEKNLHKLLGDEYQINTVRYPFGAGRHRSRTSSFARGVAEAGYIHSVLWDVDSTDPKQILRKVQNGSIILLHGRPKDLRTLKAILPKLQEKGYEMVTVSELLGLTKTTPVPVSKTKQ